MKVAIVGSSLPDSLEYNLQEAFIFRKDDCQIFDILSKTVQSNKYLSNIDKLLRNYCNKYDIKIFKTLAEKVAFYFSPAFFQNHLVSPWLCVALFEAMNKCCLSKYSFLRIQEIRQRKDIL